MAFFNFNTPKPKRFNYRPLYYDERKERLEKMKAQAEAELAAEKTATNATGSLQRGFLSRNRAKSKWHRGKTEQKSALRFFIILAALLGILYFIAPDIFLAVFGINKP